MSKAMQLNMLKPTHVLLLFLGILSIGLSGEKANGEQPAEPLRAESLPRHWEYLSDNSEAFPESNSQHNWWHRFGDIILDSLIAKGIDDNYNVLTAARRMEIARQTLNEVRSQFFPSFTLQGGWNRSRTSGAMTSASHDATVSSAFSLGVDMSWQIDLFGKIRSQSRQSKAQWQASKAEYAGVMLTLSGDIASTYIALRVAQMQKHVAESHLKSQESVLNIAKARHKAGLNSELDVLQASTVFYSTRASIPQYENTIAASINALAVLCGEIPGTSGLLRPAPMPDYRMIVSAGVPMDMLRRRPDIAEAEATLAAYAAAVGIARKDFLPTLTLEGSIGAAAHDIGDMFKANTLEYSVAPTLSWTIFEGMKRNYALAAAKEQMQIGIDNYNLTIITAVKEVENALASYRYACKEVDYLEDVVDQSKKSVELSVNLYRSGLSGFTEVADAQMNYLSYSNSLIQAKGKALTSLVTLCEALGGGWTDNQLNIR